MIAPLRVEPCPVDEPAGYGRRRRPRFGIEAQPGRCPLCNRVMSPYIGRHGPAYHCGCPEKPPTQVKRPAPAKERRAPQPVGRLPEPALTADVCALAGVH